MPNTAKDSQIALGRAIRLRREEVGVSQQHLGLELGYDQKALEGVTVTPDGFPSPSLNVLTLGIWDC